jgi:hypothetical protein
MGTKLADLYRDAICQSAPTLVARTCCGMYGIEQNSGRWHHLAAMSIETPAFYQIVAQLNALTKKLEATKDPTERLALLREYRKLIEEANRAASIESKPSTPK